MNFTEFLNYMTNNDPGAYSAISEMLNTSPSKANEILLELEKLDIRGMNIWHCYSDICKHNMETMFIKTKNGSVADELESRGYAGYKRPLASKKND